MNIKLIAVGNRLMMDDGIGIRVAEELKEELEDKGIKTIIGETDFEYCFSEIDNDDFVIILDSTFMRKTPGYISQIPLEKLKEYKQSFYSQHQMSLINMINLYKKGIKGWFIGIEIEKVDFGVNLSNTLESLFSEICNDVKKIIKKIMEGVENA